MISQTAKSDIDEDRLKHWLTATLGDAVNDLSVEKFKGGQSNPTYKLVVNGKAYVLRRKPFGKLLPSAHAVDREFKILSSLAPTPFAVPNPVALCQDEDVLGVDFYIMEFVEGRIFGHMHMPNSSPAERTDIYKELVSNLAILHDVDHKAVGLGDFERPGNFFERQVKRWTKQYRACETESIPAVESLIEYLVDSTPEQTKTSIVHGDYSLKNVSYAPQTSKINAVLDWELTTIGDPLADLTYCTMYWVMPPEDPFAMVNVDIKEQGIPALEAMQQTYAKAAGLSDLPKLDWYYAFNLFRLVGIFQGIKKRTMEGNASNAMTAEIINLISPLAERGWKIAKDAG